MGYLLSWVTLSKSATDTALTGAEIALVVSGLVLLVGAVGEYAHDHKRPAEWPRGRKLVFILMVVFGLIGEFIGDAAVFVFSSHLQFIEDTELKRLGDDANRLEGRFKSVDSTAARAGIAAETALSNSATAVSSSSTALTTARGARQEADSFENDIRLAKTASASAESHLADAHKEALDARRALDEYKKPRELSDAVGLVAALSAYKGKAFSFEWVFGDDESLDLLRVIDNVFGRAGWLRVKHPEMTIGPTWVQIYSDKNDLVKLGVRTGVRVEVESKETVEDLNARPLDKWPEHVRLALQVNNLLRAHVSPVEPESADTRVNVVSGESTVIRIKVGKKPTAP